MLDLFKTRPLLVFAVIVGNILMSAWCLSQDPVINNDGVTYIAIAQLIVDGDWQQAINYYSWPYYPLLLATVSKLLLIDLELTAHALNFFFVAALSLGFICIVAEFSEQSGYKAKNLGQHNRIVLIAALVIVLFPSLTKYRSFIIRDFAYLSCYLWSLYFIFKYCVSGRLKHLFSWLALAVLGCLLRFESIAFVLLAPYFFFLISKPDNQIRRPTLMILISLLVTVGIALFWWYANDKYSATIAHAQSQGEDMANLWDLFFANTRSENNQQLTFAIFIQQALKNLGNLAYELTRRMAVLYLIFAIITYTKNLALKIGAQKKVWLIYIGVNLLILLGFSFFNNFLVSRYTLATALTLLILSPFAINLLYEQLVSTGSTAKKVLLMFIVIVLVGISLERLNIQTDKLALKEAGVWLAENATPDARIFSTDKVINYYAGRNIDDTEYTLHNYKNLVASFVRKQIKSEDYIAFAGDLSIDKQQAMWQTFTYHFGLPIQQIKINDQHSVFIYSHHKSNLKTVNLTY